MAAPDTVTVLVRVRTPSFSPLGLRNIMESDSCGNESGLLNRRVFKTARRVRLPGSPPKLSSAHCQGIR